MYSAPRRCCQPRPRATIVPDLRDTVSKAGRRYYRTILLGLVAMAVLIWVAVDQFGISIQRMQELFLATVAVICAIVICAALFTVAWMGLRRLWRRRDGE